MKRGLKGTLALLLCAGLLGGCAGSQVTPSDSGSPSESESSVSEATASAGKPRISVPREAFLSKKGEAVDLLQGVSSKGGRGEDLTDRIVINKGGFDENTAGEYIVTYFLQDTEGNVADSKTRRFVVRETDALERYPVWEGEIPGEKPAPEPPRVFDGAWYHKVVSSKDAWLGIEAVVTLPEFHIARYDGEYDASLPVDPSAKNLDNPSIYLGGNAATESDVGLSLSKAVMDAKSGKMSVSGLAYRPFWRYITASDKDEGGYDAHDGLYAVTATGNNCFGNFHWQHTEYYYLPGDTLRMIVVSPAEGKLQLQIEVLSVSTLESSVAMREQYGWKQPENFISPVFSSPGHGEGMAEFKRVNAIDQVGNEGGKTIPTDTVVENAVWQETYLYRKIDGVLYRVPMNSSRSATTNAPTDAGFVLSTDGVSAELGGEVVRICPGK